MDAGFVGGAAGNRNNVSWKHVMSGATLQLVGCVVGDLFSVKSYSNIFDSQAWLSQAQPLWELGAFSAMGKRKPSALSSEDDSDDVQSGIGSDVGELLTEMSKGMDGASMPPPSFPGDCSVALINVRSFMCAVLDL